MPKKSRSGESGTLPMAKQILRRWILLRDRRNGSTRELPLSAVTRIHLPTKRHPEQRLNESVLRLKDVTATIEAHSIEDLVVQLREKYPDEVYECTLHSERDVQAEQLREQCLDKLAGIFIEAAVDRLIREADQSASTEAS